MSISFLVPWLLAGSALVAVPIIIHLILKKKPKHLVFPAFRYLQQRSRTNLQKLRLRHLLLLALRMLLILLICWGLSRPLLTGGPEQLATDHPLAVVMIFDTSVSMEYEQDGKSRLEEAKELAQRFLDYLPADSEAAIVDTAEPGVQFVSLRDAGQLVKNRRIRPLNQPVTSSLEEVYRLLEKSPPELPVLMTIFSDRTAASWNQDAVNALLKGARTRAEESLRGPIPCVYLDLSVAEPRNVTLAGLALKRSDNDTPTPLESLGYGSTSRRPTLQATIQVTGASIDGDLTLWMDGRLLDTKRLVVNCQPGQTVTEQVLFKPIDFPAQPANQVHQGELRLKSRDLLPGDNTRFWTLSLTERKVLIISDRTADARDWRDALESLDQLPLSCQVVTPADVPGELHPDQYPCVCLMNVASPSSALWESLQRYVSAGGGLVVMPGEDSRPDAYNTPEALAVLPGKLVKKVDVPAPGAFLAPADYEHPIMAPFKFWERQRLPGLIFRFWEVDAPANASTVVLPLSFRAEGKTNPEPAILERIIDPQKAQGRVLLFTTAMYRPKKDWNTIWDAWTYVGLTYATARHVLGSREERQNFLLRDDVRFWLPQALAISSYSLTGPETGVGEIKPGQAQLLVTEARRPGNYRVAAGDAWQRHFSTNLAAVETLLTTQRPAVTDLEAQLGDKSVYTSDQVPDLRDLTREKLGQRPSTELLPLLMIALLLALVLENLLANRFYKQDRELVETPS
jgi:hypothetical protein